MIRADRFGRLLLAGVAGLAIATPTWAQTAEQATAEAQQQPPPPRPTARRMTRGRTRRRPTSSSPRGAPRNGCSASRPRSRPSTSARSTASRRPDTDRPAGRGPEPQHRAGPRILQRDQHLHPRHRPAGRAADLRPRRRRLCRRRLFLAHPRHPARPARRRARRSAARTAGHALRQEHDRRRHQVRHRAGRARTSAPKPPPRYGSYNQLELRGHVSGPLSDTLALGVSLMLRAQRDGYVEDPQRRPRI